MASKTNMAILGILTVEPMSGYDLKQFCEESLAHFWHESFGNLYPRLKRLAARGLIRGRRTARRRGPDATVYTLTARGRKQLREWLLEPPADERVRSEFTLKFFFGAQIPRDVTETRLREYERDQKRVRERYRLIEAALHAARQERPDVEYWLMTLRRGQLLTEARLRWCRECRRTLAKVGSQGDDV